MSPDRPGGEDQSQSAKYRLFRDPGSRPYAVIAAQRAAESGNPEDFWTFFNEGKAHPELVAGLVHRRPLRRRHPNR